MNQRGPAELLFDLLVQLPVRGGLRGRGRLVIGIDVVLILFEVVNKGGLTRFIWMAWVFLDEKIAADFFFKGLKIYADVP